MRTFWRVAVLSVSLAPAVALYVAGGLAGAVWLVVRVVATAAREGFEDVTACAEELR